MTLNRRTRRVVIAGLVLSMTAFAVVSVASAAGRRGHGLQRFERSILSLELSDEVEASVSAMLDEARERHREQRPALRAAHEQMRNLMHAETLDEAAVFAQADLMGELKRKVHREQLATRLQVLALLTPAQRAELAEKGHGHQGCEESASR